MMSILDNYRIRVRELIRSKFNREGAGWLFIQQIAIAPIALGTTVLLAKVLSIADYGYYKYILSVYGIVSLFAFTGFGAIASLNIQKGEDVYFNIGFKYRKLTRWISSAVALGISLYYFYQGNNFFGILFLMTIFSHLFIEIYRLYGIGLAGQADYKLSSKLAIGEYLVSYIPPVVVAFFIPNLYYIFGVMFLCQFIYVVCCFVYVKKRFYAKKYENVSHEKLKEYKKESISISFNNALDGATGNVSSAIVFNRLGAEATAVYSLAITFADFVYGIISSPLSKLLLVLSRMSKNLASRQDKKRVVAQYEKKYFWVAILFMVVTMLALPLVYKILFAKYFFSYKFAVVYAISILTIAFYPAHQYFYEERNIKLLNTIKIIVLALGFTAMFFASTYFGLWGAIIVAIALRFGNNVVCAILLRFKNI